MNTTPDRLATALVSWMRCARASEWPHMIDTMLLATWQGVEIGWPRLDGESFSIFTVADSKEVTEDLLPSSAALDLDWQAFAVVPVEATQ